MNPKVPFNQAADEDEYSYQQSLASLNSSQLRQLKQLQHLQSVRATELRNNQSLLRDKRIQEATRKNLLPLRNLAYSPPVKNKQTSEKQAVVAAKHQVSAQEKAENHQLHELFKSEQNEFIKSASQEVTMDEISMAALQFHKASNSIQRLAARDLTKELNTAARQQEPQKSRSR